MSKNNIFPLHLDGEQHAFKASLEDKNWLWHQRYGHLNFRSLNYLSNKNLVDGLPQIRGIDEICESCIFGKQHRDVFPKRTARRATKPIELVHADVCGPMRIPSLNNNTYFIVFMMIIAGLHGSILLKKNQKLCQLSRSLRVMLKIKVGTP